MLAAITLCNFAAVRTARAGRVAAAYATCSHCDRTERNEAEASRDRDRMEASRDRMLDRARAALADAKARGGDTVQTDYVKQSARYIEEDIEQRTASVARAEHAKAAALEARAKATASTERAEHLRVLSDATFHLSGFFSRFYVDALVVDCMAWSARATAALHRRRADRAEEISNVIISLTGLRCLRSIPYETQIRTPPAWTSSTPHPLSFGADENILLIGSGERAHEIAHCMRTGGHRGQICMYTSSDNTSSACEAAGYLVVNTPDKLPAVATPFRWLAAMPPGWTAHRLAEQASRHGIMPAPTYVHPTARVDATGCELGVGGVIGPCAVIEAGVKLGKGIVVYPYVTVTTSTRPLDYDIVKPADWNRSRQAEACAWKL